MKDTTEPVYDEEFEYDDLPPARMMTMQVIHRCCQVLNKI